MIASSVEFIERQLSPLHSNEDQGMKTEIRLVWCALQWITTSLTIALFAAYSSSAMAADGIGGWVNGGGKPIARSTVTLWAAGEASSRKLAETQTGTDGHFEMPAQGKSEIFFGLAKPVRAPLVGPVRAP